MTRPELERALKKFRRLAGSVIVGVVLVGIVPVVIGAYFSSGYRYSEQIEWVALFWMVVAVPTVLWIGVYILLRNRISCPQCKANLNNRVTKESGNCWKCGQVFD